MKNKSKIIILTIISISLLSFASKVIPKDEFLVYLEEKLALFNHKKPREFVYLMNDKPFYKPGESIWFSAWITEGNFLTSTRKSQKLYVELINPKGKVAKTLQLPIFSGRTNGDFELGTNDAGGIYKLKAYTHYSKNFGKQHFFEKEITVQKIVMPRLLMKLDFQKKAYAPGDLIKADFSVNDLENNPVSLHNCKYSIYLNGELQTKEDLKTDEEGKVVVEYKLPDNLSTNDGLLNIQLSYNGEKESISRSVPIILNNISIDFYPEGGQLIAHSKCQVAFKALNEFGKPADFEAVLLDEENREITKFSSFYHGFGSFEFEPKRGQNYRVKVTKPVGVQKEFLLPEIIDNGSVLRLLGSENDKLKLGWRSEKKDSIYLVASVRDIIYYSEKISSYQGKNTKVLKTKDWPFGIAKISLFNKERVLVSERLVYVGSRSPMNVTIQTEKEEYLPGEEVNIKLIAKDDKDQPIKAKLALSVVDNKLFTFADDKQDNILSYLLMSNELSEKIEEPLYYFNIDKEKAWRALDYVLMCSKLKRLSWLQLIGSQPYIRYFADRPGTVSGRIIDKETRKGVEATVWLGENKHGSIESEGRSAHLQTTPKGYFTFFNVDLNAIVYLFAKSKQIKVENLQILTEKELQSNETDFGEYVKDVPEKIIVKKENVKQKKGKKGFNVNLNMGKRGKGKAGDVAKADLGAGLIMDTEDVGIDECVVVGYGTVKKNDLTGSVYVIEGEDIFNYNILSALDGSIAGVQIINQNPGATDNIKIRIRGANSFNNNENPLYVVDGVPLILGQNQNNIPLSYLNPEDISSITVFKDAQAQALYGTSASNGAIIINTKRKRQKHFQSEKKGVKSPYVSKIIYPKKTNFSKRRRFDAYLQNIERGGSRSDFRSTLYWEPLIETDKNGEATISFKNSDEVSSFKIVVEGLSESGAPGRVESEYHTSLPVYVAAKMPAFVCFADTVSIPLLLTNNTEEEVSGELSIDVSTALSSVSEIPVEVSLKAKERKVIPLKYYIENKAGKGSLNIRFVNSKFNDEVKREFEVVPVGFPVLKSFSAQELDKEYEFEISDALNGSLQVQLTAYPNVISDVFSGVEGLLREPYGCFEQTSVSSYPNLLVMDYLKTTDNMDKKVLAKAKGLLRKGYSRLTSFETKTKGYEWFGGSPGHEALTAYGLMQFNDMKSVSNYVDDKMIFRTANWLMEKKDGKGEFKRNSRALDTYGRADKDITNAYIVYALAEAGYKDIKLEFKTSYDEAIKSKDAYVYALLTNSAICFKDKAKATTLLTLLYAEQNKNGSWAGKRHSITCSSGNSLIVETTSLVAMAIMKSENPDRASLNKAIEFLISSRSGYGTFGSTQATILALKAITHYAKFSKQTEESGTIEIYIDGKKVAQQHYEKGENQALIMDGLEQFISEGKHKVKIKFVGCEEALPYSLAVNWRTKTPQSNNKCKLKLECKLQTNHVSVSDVVRMSVKLSNTKNKGLPMSMIKIGIPGGLSPQPWQLKELRDKKIIDFYEIFDNYLVFYFRQMKPEEIKHINLDLKAEMAGDYEGAASCAYLYYTDEDKDWLEGLKIKIKQ